MLTRPVAAIFAVAMLTLAGVSLSHAQGLPECVAKDEVISSVLSKAGA